jgi:hypothetical protein
MRVGPGEWEDEFASVLRSGISSKAARSGENCVGEGIDEWKLEFVSKIPSEISPGSGDIFPKKRIGGFSA